MVNKTLQKKSTTNTAITVRITALAVLVITFITYYPSVNSDFLNWDDDRYVLNNPYIKTKDLILTVLPFYKKFEYSRRHPATRVFQAMRIWVNDELGNLEAVIPQAIELLEPQGRLAIISFHSLEDRIVKWRFRDFAKQGIAKIITKKPIVPSEKEVGENPRSRSAKLRVIERL